MDAALDTIVPAHYGADPSVSHSPVGRVAAP